MANVFKLKRSTTELSMIAGEGNGLRGQVWYPEMGNIVYGRTPPYITEQIDLVADRTSHDDLATTLQALDQMRWWAAMQRVDPTVQHPVWLHAKMDGETGERRAYVRDISGNWRSNQIDTSGLPADHDALLRLNVERHPYWEETSATTGPTMSETSGASVMFNYGNISGDVPARLTNFVLRMGNNDEYLWRLWMGIRSPKFGTPSNFVNIWELEDATDVGTDCSAPQSDSTASPGSGNTRREVTFATEAGWAGRLGIYLTDVTSNYADQMGRLLWLLRARVDSGTTCEAYLEYGHSFGTTGNVSIQGPIVEISNSGWDYKEMGESNIPLLNAQMVLESGTHPARTFYVALRARRTAGSGSLYLDCLCPIPLDEGWLIAKDIVANTTNDRLNYLQLPDDKVVVYRGLDGRIGEMPSYSHQNFSLPPGNGGRMVIVYAGSEGVANPSILGNSIAIATSDRYLRWLNLRGSE